MEFYKEDEIPWDHKHKQIHFSPSSNRNEKCPTHPATLYPKSFPQFVIPFPPLLLEPYFYLEDALIIKTSQMRYWEIF